MLRAGAILLICAALAGCGERDFDERYAEQEKKLTSEAANLEAELGRRMAEKPGLESATSDEVVEGPASAAAE